MKLQTKNAEFRIVPKAYVPILAILDRLNLDQLAIAVRLLRSLESGDDPRVRTMREIEQGIREGFASIIAETKERLGC